MSNWSPETKKDLYSKIILFIISPIISLIYSFKRINTRSSYFIFFITSVLFGLAFTVELPNQGSGESYIDGQFYRANFESYVNRTELEFTEKFNRYISFDSNVKDFFFDTIAFYTSRVTDNYHIMFMIVAIIFSYFALKSLKFFTSEESFDNSIVSYILLYLFLSNQIFNINGLRFWTAAWIAVYCIFQIYKNKNNLYYLLALLTPFFHGSYIVFIVVLILARTLRKFDRFWIFMFFLSLVFSNLSLYLVQFFTETFNSYLPPFITRLAEQYTSAEEIASRKEWSGFGWIYIGFGYIKLAYLTGLLLLLFSKRKIINSHSATKDLFRFLIVWTTCFNFLLPIPSLGGRFLVLSYPLIAYIWLICFKDKYYQWYILLLPIAFFWELYSYTTRYLRVLDPTSLIFNPLYLIYNNVLNF